MRALHFVALGMGMTLYATALVVALLVMGAVALVVPARFLKENPNGRQTR